MEAPIKVDILRSEGEATTAPREAHRGKINCEPISLTTSRLMAAGSICALLIVLCVLLGPLQIHGDTRSGKPLKGLIDINGYYDTREFTVLTINLLASLPWRLQYFSLTNYSNPIESDTAQDLENFYSEQNLR